MFGTIAMPSQNQVNAVCGGFSHFPQDVARQQQAAEQKLMAMKAEEKKKLAAEKSNSVTFFGTTFDLPDRYTPIKAIGRGTFGVVISATDHLTNNKVAIKKISKAFESAEDAKRLLREIKLMKHFRDEETLLYAVDAFCGNEVEGRMNDIYIVTELMETDMSQVINSNQSLSDEHIQCFVYQILRGIQALHSADVLHRDLKPANILLNADCTLKVCDFGLARYVETFDNELTDYVATRWYRAPEVILSWKHYAKALDIWSIGCIFAELLGRKPLFRGTHYLDQVHKIIEVIGTPTHDEIENIRSPAARDYMYKQTRKEKTPFSNLFPKASPLALDLLERMLTFDPSKRITVEEALQHPYLQSWRDSDDPVTSATEISGFDFEGDNLTTDDIKELIWSELSGSDYPVYQLQAA